MKDLIFLKLGGSLITDKNIAHYARLEVIKRIAGEIAHTLQVKPGMKLLVGHGSGSYGHIAAQKFNTIDGVKTPSEWRGFAEVGREARALNTIVMESLAQAGLPVITFSPCSQVTTRNHQVIQWEMTGINTALKNGLLPLVYGDVVFDLQIGGTILSTEDLFEYLAAELKPERILLAGIEPGIWQDFPDRSEIFKRITPHHLPSIDKHLAASISPDVTGGMRSKVYSMLNLIESGYCHEVCIFSGQEDNSIFDAINGDCTGTTICLD